LPIAQIIRNQAKKKDRFTTEGTEITEKNKEEKIYLFHASAEKRKDFCHEPRERHERKRRWIPAFAGMTHAGTSIKKRILGHGWTARNGNFGEKE